MNPYETKFERYVCDEIGKDWKKAADDLAEGSISVEKYREQVGYLRGLKMALSIISHARAELANSEGKIKP